VNLRATYTGLTVCDLSQGIAGPHATMLLAQFGANVIKVEPPDGDWGRKLGEQAGDHCAHSWHYNLGKRSLVLDLKRPDGRQILRDIVARSGVFVESFRPGVAERLGFSYDAVRSIRPDIIYASMSGFGQRGPYSRRGTVDALMQGFSGMMVMNRTASGVAQRINMVVVDVLTGLYLHGLLATAIARRQHSGEGCYLDVSMMQAAAAFQGAKIAEHHASKGASRAFYGPVGRLPTSDGAVAISCRKHEHFEALCFVLGHPEIAGDPRFAAAEGRVANAAELMKVLGQLTEAWRSDALLAQLQAAGILVERIQSYGEWMADPHVLEVQAFDWFEHEGFGRLPLPRLPGLPAADGRQARAPGLGEHSLEILSELGTDEARLATLLGQGVILGR
jgi:crotonobetainyl-CoA:carnitine CoA-transferase CaiB-like acyl-CoA transferase